MLKVVETFSGIGSQAKALRKSEIQFEVVNTVEWDINATYAYDIIHNGPQDISNYIGMGKEELVDRLLQNTISNDGKKPISRSSLKMMSADALRRFLAAIVRTKNLVNIIDVKAEDLPNNIDLLTYSFPCQDLSICGSWHGNMSGIDRTANNRSGMLWEVERILKEYVEIGKRLPNFLLMENVSNILSKNHRDNFNEWETYLHDIGYINQIYTLDASNFGIPQRRKRTYMLSVYMKNSQKTDQIKKYFDENNLEKLQNVHPKKLLPLNDFFRTDYKNPQYKYEADISNPNYTESRRRIHNENPEIYDGEKATCSIINTITTKQDRNPNSGLLMYKGKNPQKSPYRNLTPRECFLLMGFEEKDYQALIDNDFNKKGNQRFVSREKMIKMAGNSIVVNVLEAVFKQIAFINENIIQEKVDNNDEKNIMR